MPTNAHEKLEAQIVDWDQFDELPEGEQVELDPEQDAFEQIAPPPPGVYDFKVDFAPDNPQVKYTDKNEPYYSARLELTLVDNSPEYEGAKVYPTVTTLIGRGKNISTMASLMIKGGGKLTSTTATSKQVMADFRKWVLSEPTIKADVDWQVGFQDSDGTWTTKYSSQKAIPERDGSKPFRFEFLRKDKSMVQTGAILQVKTYFAKGDNPVSRVGNNANGVVSANTKPASSLPKKQVVIDEDEVAELEKEIAASTNGKRR